MSRTARAAQLVTNLPPLEWNSDTAVAYEATQELLNEVIGCHVALLNRERTKLDLDPDQIRRIREQIAEVDQRQRTLDPTDSAGIASVRNSYRAVLDGLRAELR